MLSSLCGIHPRIVAEFINNYYQGANGFILVFNVADQESFDDLSAW